MDSPVSPRTLPRTDADINDVRALYFKIEHGTSYPPTMKRKTAVVKYTRLPDFDFDKKVCQSLKPRLRRIIELDDPQLDTVRSLKLNTVSTSTVNPTSKRKIVSISKDEEKRPASSDSGESKLSAKTTNPNKKEQLAPKATFRSSHILKDNLKSRSTKEKEQSKIFKNTPNSPELNLSKNVINPSESQKVIASIKNDLDKNLNHTQSSKRLLGRNRFNTKTAQNKSKIELFKEIPLSKPITVIHVPMDNSSYETRYDTENKHLKSTSSLPIQHFLDCGTDIDKQFLPKDANVGTPPLPTMVNEETETSNNTLVAELTQDVFDNLDIPNVTLVKDKSNFAKEEIVSFCSRSLPNLQAPPFKIRSEKKCNGDLVGFGKSKTYIIGRATFTYTTKQKINFHVVGSSDDSPSNQSPSPLAYPLNVVSLLKNNLNHCDTTDSSGREHHLPNERDKTNSGHKNVDELQALTCPHVFNNEKLVKPSDLISTIRVNNGLLHNDYICEQFQRELHFIDSFFETLQYLESCSLSEKCFSKAASEDWARKTRFDLNNSEYSSFLANLENGAGSLAHVDDIETMASKSLCLLNLLIRDEQRRAKNLLFVLKMREDALKDFTKSQIIWLENKKKQDNTDVSTLKKKQRGALLKLQHECGEMQRMRKALLTLSEKRKAALMKTRNNIELKLNNNVDVEQMLLGKKKLKRNIASDRNVAPLKCFDLSSSGCEESTPPKPKLEIPVALPELPSHLPLNTCAEKCVQTGDSIFEPVVLADQTTDTADEKFVGVDGGYLNILFQHLSLPQIFSSGKQYEVNESALRNIVESSNKPNIKDNCFSDVVENFMDKIKNRDSDRSSSLSTAHSLVDEFDQYYKGLSDGSKSPSIDSTDTEHHNNTVPQMQVYEYSETYVQVIDSKPEQSNKCCGVSTAKYCKTVEPKPEQSDKCCGVSTAKYPKTVEPVVSSDTLTCVHEDSVNSLDTQPPKNSDVSLSTIQTGPLPVPPGATSPEPVTTDSSISPTMSSGSSTRSDSQDSNMSPVSSLSPGQNEAEELRRQQLAIEREIKALEQQQNQLLVVREIPDKPPPPYTPPSNLAHKTARMFIMTEDDEDRILRSFTHGEEISCDLSDPFSVFIGDICKESLAGQNMELSDQPWDACNLLPLKPELSPEKRGHKAIDDIKQVLSCVQPTVVSGVGARRSDHIDDILFAEWRRCEPEWTTLQTDEATVKARVFESLFQKILSETIDQYKQTVLGLITPDTTSENLVKKKSKQSKLES